MIFRIKKAIKSNYPIITIVLIAFCIRWYGIYFNYPFGVESIGDESVIMRYLMDIINNKNIFAGASCYPVLSAFIYLPVLVVRIFYIALFNNLHSIEEIKGFIIGNGIGQIYIITRWIAVLFGTASVYLIYRIYQVIYNNKIASIYASLAYTFSIIPIVLSHWGKQHATMTFFFLLSLYFILRFETEKKKKYFLLSTTFAAMSFSVHYIGILSFIFPLVGFLNNRSIFSIKIFIQAISATFLVFIFGFLANYKGIIAMVSGVYYGFFVPNNHTGLFPVGGFERFYYGLVDVFRIEPVFFLLFVIIILIYFKRFYYNKLTRYILAGLLISYLLLLGVAGAHLSRWLLIFITLSTTLAASTLVEYLQGKNTKKFILYFIVIFLLIPNIFFVSRWLMLFQGNTRNEVVEWSRVNVKNDQFIYAFDNWLDVPLSYEAIAWDKKNNSRYSKKQDYILDHPDVIKNIHGINLIHDYMNERFDKLAGTSTKYVLFHYWTSGDIKDYYEFPTKKDAYHQIEEVKKYHKIKLVKTFFPTSNPKMIKSGVDDYFNSPHSWYDLLYLEKSGPFIEIYEIIK